MSQSKAFLCDVVLERSDSLEYSELLDGLGDDLIENNFVGSLPPKPTKLPNQQSFSQQLNELVSTEKSYVKRITALKLNYSDPLRQFAKHKDTQIINLFDAKTLFGNIDQLVTANTAFLNELEHANEFNIGNICLAHFPNFTCYNQYYFNRQKSVDLFKDLLKKKSFVEFIDRTKWQTTGLNNIGLRELLMEPVQRIPRYILLFQGMMNYLDEQHDQRTQLYKSLDLASKIASCEADETTKRATLMHTLQRNIQNFPPNLISHNRTLIDCLDVNDLPTPMTGHIEEPLPCTVFLFNDKLVIAKRPSSNSRGRKLSGLDDLDASNPSATPAKSWGISKTQLVCKIVADLSELTVTDLSNEVFSYHLLAHLAVEFGVVFQSSAFSDCDDERFNRTSKAFQVTQVAFSPSEPLSTASPMSRFITKIWKQQALLRAKDGNSYAKISRDWLPLMSGAVAGGRGNGQARLYFNVYESRDKWFRSANKSKAVLQVDGTHGQADSIPVGEGGTLPLLVIRAEAMEGNLCRLTTEFSNPPETLNEIMNIEDVYTRVVWHIQAQGLYDYKPAGLATMGKKRERAPSSPTKLKFESISKGFFKNGNSGNKLGVPDQHDFSNSTNSHNSHRRTRSLVSKSSSTFGSLSSAVISTPATSVEGPSGGTGKPPSPLPKSPPQQTYERKVKRKQTPASHEAEREAAEEAYRKAECLRAEQLQQEEEERQAAIKKAEEEVELLNYRDRVRASYLDRPHSVPPPSTSNMTDEDGDDSDAYDDAQSDVADTLRRRNTRSSMATVGNYSIRSEATTSVPWGSDTEARTSDATQGNGSTISNSTSVDLRFSESDSFPIDQAEADLDRQPSYVPGGADEATVGARTDSGRTDSTHSKSRSTSRRRSSSLPSYPTESVSSSLIPPEPAFSMSRQPTTSSVWSRSTGLSASSSTRKPFGPRQQSTNSSRGTPTPRVGTGYRMDLPVVRPLSIPSKKPVEDTYGYTNALNDWVYGDDRNDEKENARSMPPPSKPSVKRHAVMMDLGLENRKRKWGEIQKEGNNADYLEYLIDSLDQDAQVWKKHKSGEINEKSFKEMEIAKYIETEVARKLQERVSKDEEKMKILEKQLMECKNEISVLYESFNEELDGMYADVNSGDDAIEKMSRDLFVAKSQRNEYLKISTELKQQLDLLM
ncbi:hypothetical protein E3Q10_03156 [Wallemia mellicola]|uniref:DH domain-containing protein n=1 Tax=Wallemia mellicola TaxID=1708541 RepID=A0A4T0QTW3_9BASI|nr:hypothetical protein E3Q10_03156 [Wallemia mellicola]